MGTKTKFVQPRRGIDVRDFIPGGRITDDKISDALEDAKAQAYDETSEAAGWCYDVHVPEGKYTLPALPHFAGTGINTPTPGLVGAGSYRTRFVVQPGAGNWALTCGEDADGTGFTFHQQFRGFTILAAGGSQPGNGIDIRQGYYQQLEDVIVQGFQQTQGYANGVGLRMVRPIASVSPHQHARMRKVLTHTCQTGIALRSVVQGTFENVDSHFSTWLTAVIENCQIDWRGPNLQGGFIPDLDRWFGLPAGNGSSVVSGFGYTAGMQSGAAAAIATASGAFTTVTGLTGLDRILDRGRWLRLTDGSPLSPDKTTGVYKIVEVLSATSCIIMKGSTHTARTGLAWQVCGHSGGNYLTLGGAGYDEGAKLATCGFYRDEATSSLYTIRDATLSNATYPIDTDGIATLVLEGLTGVGTYAARCRETLNVRATDVLSTQLVLDDFSYEGAISRYKNDTPGYSGQIGGFRDSNGGRSKRVRSLCKELGAAEAWDPRIASLLSLSGADVLGWTGCLNGTVCTPVNAGIEPLYDAADSAFNTPVVRTLGNANPALQGILGGAISAGVLPASQPYNSSVFCVYRYTNTTENDGLGGGTRGIMFIDASNQAALRLQFNDGAYVLSPATYGGIYSAQASGVTTSPTFGGGITLLPRAAAFNISGRTRAQRYTTDLHGDEWQPGSSTAHGKHAPGVAMNVQIGMTGHGQPQGSITIAFLAWFPRSLTRAEQLQLVDLARNEWPIGR